LTTQLFNAFESILEMPFYLNEAARSGITIHAHEDAISARLQETGFTKLPNGDFPKLKKKISRAWEDSKFKPDFLENVTNTKYKTKKNITFGDMPRGSFIEQPAGGQSFPDFLVRDFNGKFLAVEAKSGKNGTCPMWNDSLPKHGAIYILSSGKINQTTVFLGEDVISEEELNIRKEYDKKQLELIIWGRKQMKSLDKFQRGFDFKSRSQNFQGGGLKKTNYFTHQDRLKCEANVLNSVKT